MSLRVRAGRVRGRRRHLLRHPSLTRRAETIALISEHRFNRQAARDKPPAGGMSFKSRNLLVGEWLRYKERLVQARPHKRRGSIDPLARAVGDQTGRRPFPLSEPFPDSCKSNPCHVHLPRLLLLPVAVAITDVRLDTPSRCSSCCWFSPSSWSSVASSR